MAVRVGLTQKQSAGMVPEHILGRTVLKMGLQELQQFLHAEFGENPALALEDCYECPACHSPLVDGVCPICGAHEMTAPEDQPAREDEHDWQEDLLPAVSEVDDNGYPEQFAGVAAPQSLPDYLREQIRAEISEEDRPLAEYIVDSLDEDGYLREPMIDIATMFGLSVPQAETVLRQVQVLDPPGVAARDLRECLSIQLGRLSGEPGDRTNAKVLVDEHWESVSRLKLDEASSKMGLSRKQVESAIAFMRESLNPHPAAMFHDPWQDLAPRRVPRAAPDLVVRCGEHGTEIEVIDPVSGRVAIDPVYASMCAEITTNKNSLSEEDRVHVREFATKARTVIEAIEFRKSTLRKIADEILRRQAAFFADGPSALKPMTRKELAQEIGVHESTVCRATQDKAIRLPSGDVISFEVLFDSALPVKELVRQLAAQRLTDGEIAKKLEEAGIQIARRTVAKYRDQLRVLPMEYRLAS